MDESEHALRAFDWFAKSPGAEDDRIFIHHTVEIPKSYGAPAVGLPIQSHSPAELREAKERAKRIREIFSARCRNNNLQCDIITTEPSDPRIELLKAVDQYQADILVLGNRGYGVMGQLIGSVSEYILHHSQVPVLIIPPKGHRPKLPPPS